MPVTRHLRRGYLFCSAILGFGFVLLTILYYRKEVSERFATIVTSNRWASLLSSTCGNCTSSQLENKTNAGTTDIWFSTFLLILVPTRPLDKDSRQLIRDTWFEGFNNSKDVVLRFIVGIKAMEAGKIIKLTEENGTFGDVIFIDLKESYNALTNKTLALISWAHHHVNFSYLLKCDDDSYAFVKNMIVELKKRPTDTKLYYGKFFMASKVARGKTKCADNDWNFGPYYIPYAMGGGYILSHDIVSFLSLQSPHLMWHINEDTAVGAWVSALNHERRSDRKFCVWWKGSTIASRCINPLLLMIFVGHTNEDIKKHFQYFHEHNLEALSQYVNSTNAEIDQ